MVKIMFMINKKWRFASYGLLLLLFLPLNIEAQNEGSFRPDFNSPAERKGMKLVWNDEFNYSGKPDTSFWIFEKGFVRNQELQWYQDNNANCSNGLLVIEGRREKIRNPFYQSGSTNWKFARENAEYSSASIQTKGHKQWKFGRFEIRARIDTSTGSWPAIWTLGISKSWPSNGEIDIMEFYRVNGTPAILANFAWGTEKRNIAKWDDLKKPLADFLVKDPSWPKKFHIWRMDWNKDSVSLFLDDQLLNSVIIQGTSNPDGFNPFLQPHFLLLNLAIGSNGGNPSKTVFPIKYEIDYVRVYQEE
jgi:beta-glucanase (GH16 family)